MTQSNRFLQLYISVLFIISIFFSVSAQTPERPVADYYSEVSNYVKEKAKELSAQGKKLTSDTRDDLINEQKKLAKKYASEISLRQNLKDEDLYFLGMLYNTAEDEDKTLETLKQYLAQNPPDAKNSFIQSARSFIVVLLSKDKQMTEAEQVYQTWLKDEQTVSLQQPTLEVFLASGFFKDNQYEQAIKYGQHAFETIKTLEAKTPKDKHEKEQIYINLVEVLALSHKKDKNKDAALEILAEARAQSFTLPSANLYRKVMDFVSVSGFSEKKLMEKVESYPNSDPAPELKILEWIGQEPVALEKFRGKIVLLDFWATWCKPCISTFPRLRGWHKKYGSDDFEIIGVTQYYGNGGGKDLTPSQELSFLGEFKEKYKMPYPIVVADRGEDTMKYGIGAYPTTILLDRNGVVRYIGIGAGREESENLEDMIKKLINEGVKTAASK